MIVEHLPRARHAWTGILWPLGLLLGWDVAVTAAYYADPDRFPTADIQFSLFGTAIALFIGFTVNAAYARWWEARSLWGLMVNASRSLARQVVTLVDDPTGEWHRRLVRTHIAYVHVLRTTLREQPLPPEAETYLSPEVRGRLDGAGNPANALVADFARTLAEARRAGAIGAFEQVRIETTLVDVSNAQGGIERINGTPLPVQYRVFPAFFARLFCVLLPFAVVADLGWATPVGSGLVGLMLLMAVQVAKDLADPFVDGVYDVPITTLCRTIEIDLSQMIGQPPPERVVAVGSVQW